MKAEVAITTPVPILKQATNHSEVGSPLAGWNSKDTTFKPVSNQNRTYKMFDNVNIVEN